MADPFKYIKVRASQLAKFKKAIKRALRSVTVIGGTVDDSDDGLIIRPSAASGPKGGSSGWWAEITGVDDTSGGDPSFYKLKEIEHDAAADVVDPLVEVEDSDDDTLRARHFRGVANLAVGTKVYVIAGESDADGNDQWVFIVPSGDWWWGLINVQVLNHVYTVDSCTIAENTVGGAIVATIDTAPNLRTVDAFNILEESWGAAGGFVQGVLAAGTLVRVFCDRDDAATSAPVYWFQSVPDVAININTPDDWLDYDEATANLTHTNPVRPLAGIDISFTMTLVTGAPALADDAAGTVTASYPIDTLKIDAKGHTDDATGVAAPAGITFTGDDTWTKADLPVASEIRIYHETAALSGASPLVDLLIVTVDFASLAVTTQTSTGSTVTIKSLGWNHDSAGHCLGDDGLPLAALTFTIPNNIDDLADVTITSPATGAFLRYNGTVWIDDSASIDDLSDVDTTTHADVTSDLLMFDGTNWVPKTILEIIKDSGRIPGYNASNNQVITNRVGVVEWEDLEAC